MGDFNTEKCLLTGFDVKYNLSNSEKKGYEYVLELNNKVYYFNISEFFNPTTSDILKAKLYIIKGLMLNGLWPDKSFILDENDLERIVINCTFPRLPKEKLDHLFEFLFKIQSKDGERFETSHFFEHSDFANSLYLNDEQELEFYLRTLISKGLIEGNFSPTEGDYDILWNANITYTGLEYYLKLTNEGQKSKRCFIAMNFDDNMQETRLAIKSACRNTGFEPILIDEIHFDADTTINDAIIAELKKSKFCISDFTGQKDGVYFEAGFALGRGLKVIYSVHKDDLKNSHFDTKHFPHITYETTKELKEKLINKIEAWIKE